MNKTFNLEEIDQIASELLVLAGARKTIVFQGEIGAGKTTLIKAFCRMLKVEDTVSSPTFSLVNEYTYDIMEGARAYVYHLDLYRLNTIEEALDIGLEEYLHSTHYCLIEWPDLIEPLLPNDTLRIKIEIVDNSTRKIIFL